MKAPGRGSLCLFSPPAVAALNPSGGALKHKTAPNIAAWSTRRTGARFALNPGFGDGVELKRGDPVLDSVAFRHGAVEDSFGDLWLESLGLTWRVGRDGVPLESPNGRDWLVWREPGSETFEARPVHERLRSLPHHRNDRIRVGSDYKNRPTRSGYRSMVSTGDWVWWESSVEEAALIDLDFAADLVGIAAQPFRILFRDACRFASHDVDFFCVLRSGDRRIINVKHENRLEDDRTVAQFAEAHRVCREIGWTHEVTSGPSDIRRWNLEVIEAASAPHLCPTPTALRHVLQTFANGETVGNARSRINRRAPSLSMPDIHHLLWHQLLTTNLDDEVIDFGTVVTTSANHLTDARCCS